MGVKERKESERDRGKLRDTSVFVEAFRLLSGDYSHMPHSKLTNTLPHPLLRAAT